MIMNVNVSEGFDDNLLKQERFVYNLINEFDCKIINYINVIERCYTNLNIHQLKLTVLR